MTARELEQAESKKPSNNFQINPNRLDFELTRQPELFYSYATELAKARNKVAELKAAIEVLKADLAVDIRNDPQAFGLQKVTEAGVEAAIVQQTSHQKALAGYNRAKFEMDIAQVAVDSMEQKGTALGGLVKLHGQSYFATPAVDQTSREIMEKEAKTVRGPLRTKR